MPVTIGSVVVPSTPLSYLMRTTRLSDDDVWYTYSQWSDAKFGDRARPSRPPSPLVVTTPGSLPSTVFWPDSVTRTISSRSRSATSAEVSGRNAMPHGRSSLVMSRSNTGSPPPPVPLVLTVISGLKSDVLPLASLARTLNLNELLAARPSAVAVRSGTVANTTPSLATSYPATPVLSVDASQFSVMLLALVFVACRLVGTEGGVVSSLFGVVMSSELLACDGLSAASRAATVMTYLVFGVRLRTTVCVTLPPTSAMTLPPLNTWYMATPTLSVDGSEASSMEGVRVC